MSTMISTGMLATLAIASATAIALLAGCAGQDRVSMSAVSTSYTCPLTGEELPCEDCCPLNNEQAATEKTGAEQCCTGKSGADHHSTEHATKHADASSEDGYVCPINGEILPCPNCCPLNN